MSTGIVFCSACRREVHQHGRGGTWLHCEDRSPICPSTPTDTVAPQYPNRLDDIVGRWCGRDDDWNRPRMTPQQRAARRHGIEAPLVESRPAVRGVPGLRKVRW